VTAAAERDWLEPVAPVVDSPFRALDALAQTRRPAEPLAPRSTPPVKARVTGREPLRWTDIERLARRHELPLVPGELAADEEAAVRSARRLGFPVALKVVAPALWHRTELGLLRVNLTAPEDVAKGFRQLTAAAEAVAITNPDGYWSSP